MKRAVLSIALVLLFSSNIGAEERRAMAGIVLKVEPSTHTMVVSCQAVPGYAEAMVMSFYVRQAEALFKLKPGAMIDFAFVVDGASSYAENIRLRRFENLEQKPLEARRLSFLTRLANPAAGAGMLAPGQQVTDFVLTDQTGQRVAFSKLAGNVVAITFAYMRCANPAYCFRLASNLGHVQKRFANRLGRDLVLSTIVLDPEHDQKDALADYARIWTENPQAWHFLTGPLSDVKRVAGMFGVEFWKDEGSVIHSFGTAIVDRDGTLVANLEGNEFTPEQFGDLVQTVLDRSPAERR